NQGGFSSLTNATFRCVRGDGSFCDCKSDVQRGSGSPPGEASHCKAPDDRLTFIRRYLEQVAPQPGSSHFMRAKICVGMPCYNSERWISAAIESLLAQSHGDFELIVCDNASTDGTWDLVQHYATNDARVKPHRNPENLGASANYNRVFELSSAPYFKWASSNDWCAPAMLASCLDALETDPGAVL